MQISSGNEKDVYMAEKLEEGATIYSCRLTAPGADGGRRQWAFIDAIAFVSRKSTHDNGVVRGLRE
jgi:hypothetical protein